MLALSDDLDVHPEQLVAQDENLALVRLERHKRGEVTQSPGFVAVMHDDALGLGCLAEGESEEAMQQQTLPFKLFRGAAAPLRPR